MRHNKKINHLGRTSAHRKAMLSNMASSLILNKRINTTVAKAKALRKYVEPLITKAKNDTTHNRRIVFSYLQNKYAVTELFREVAAKVGDRPGGYTRILKTTTRLGDAADMCIIELVDYNENMLAAKETSKKSRRRSRSKSKQQVENKSSVKIEKNNSEETVVQDIKTGDIKPEETAAQDVKTEEINDENNEISSEEINKEENSQNDTNQEKSE